MKGRLRASSGPNGLPARCSGSKSHPCPAEEWSVGIEEDGDAEVAAAFGLLGEHGDPMRDSVPGLLNGG